MVTFFKDSLFVKQNKQHKKRYAVDCFIFDSPRSHCYQTDPETFRLFYLLSSHSSLPFLCCEIQRLGLHGQVNNNKSNTKSG